jgi:hypothetical protein
MPLTRHWDPADRKCMRLRWMAAVAMVMTGCTSMRSRPPTPLPLDQLPPEQPAVRVQTTTVMEAEGTRLLISMDPVLHRFTIEDGTPVPAWSPMDLHPISEMRSCLAADGPCSPEEPWRPFELIEEHRLQGNSGGAVWVGLEFRQVDGTPVAAFETPGALYWLLALPVEVEAPAGQAPTRPIAIRQLPDATLLPIHGVPQ